MPIVILTIKETVTIGRSLHGMLSLPTLLLFLGICAVRKMIHSLVAESEYNASTKVCYKMLFICVFYLFMGIVVNYPYRSTR